MRYRTVDPLVHVGPVLCRIVTFIEPVKHCEHLVREEGAAYFAFSLACDLSAFVYSFPWCQRLFKYIENFTSKN